MTTKPTPRRRTTRQSLHEATQPDTPEVRRCTCRPQHVTAPVFVGPGANSKHITVAKYPVTVATFRNEQLVSLVLHHWDGRHPCPMPDQPIDPKTWLLATVDGV